MYPQMPGYGLHEPVKRSTNPFAIASLVLAICGGTLLSIVFGIVALVQIRRSGQGGKGLAVSGLVISGIWILAIVGAIIAAIVSPPSPTSTRNQSTGTTDVQAVTLGALRAGDCLVTVPTGRVFTLDRVSCRLPHRGEVFAVYPLTGSTYPGDDDVASRAEDACFEQLDTYLSPTVDEDSIEVYYFPPTRQTWTAGDKNVICVAESTTMLSVSIRRR